MGGWVESQTLEPKWPPKSVCVCVQGHGPEWQQREDEECACSKPAQSRNTRQFLIAPFWHHSGSTMEIRGAKNVGSGSPTAELPLPTAEEKTACSRLMRSLSSAQGHAGMDPGKMLKPSSRNRELFQRARLGSSAQLLSDSIYSNQTRVLAIAMARWVAAAARARSGSADDPLTTALNATVLSIYQNASLPARTCGCPINSITMAACST